jgi:hypothetical protein
MRGAIIRISIALALSLFFTITSFAATVSPGAYEPVFQENNPKFIEVDRIRIFNVVGGTIEVSSDKGASWDRVGSILYPTSSVSNNGYTASKWIEEGKISAVAVNAIHIKTGFNTFEARGIIFSVLPKDQLQVPDYYNSYISPDSSIYTDIKAGTSIFGGVYSPYVGNIVSTSDALENLYPIGLGFVPSIGDVLVVVVNRPARYPKEIVFENRFGGLINLEYLDGEDKVIGVVLRPVMGVGRFLGTQYCDTGRIRANHPGVIDVSTSPLGETGGFQIIPSGHGMSDEMITARLLTQWMVVGPPRVTDPSPEGIAPLFKYFLNPRYLSTDLDDPDWGNKVLQTFLVEVKLKGNDHWQPMPKYSIDPDLRKPLPGWANDAFRNVTHFRILFPILDKLK